MRASRASVRTLNRGTMAITSARHGAASDNADGCDGVHGRDGIVAQFWNFRSFPRGFKCVTLQFVASRVFPDHLIPFVYDPFVFHTLGGGTVYPLAHPHKR